MKGLLRDCCKFRRGGDFLRGLGFGGEITEAEEEVAAGAPEAAFGFVEGFGLRGIRDRDQVRQAEDMAGAVGGVVEIEVRPDAEGVGFRVWAIKEELEDQGNGTERLDDGRRMKRVFEWAVRGIRRKRMGGK